MQGSNEKFIQNFGQKKWKKPLRRHMHRWEGSIIMDLRKIGWEDVEWIHLAQDKDDWWALVNTVMNLQVP